jgi:hypothetical protein
MGRHHASSAPQPSSLPSDPVAGITTIDKVITQSVVTITIAATNIPPGTLVNVNTVQDGNAGPSGSAPLMGTLASSGATVNLPFARRLRTELILTASFGGPGPATVVEGKADWSPR